jgi:hypothetical protein
MKKLLSIAAGSALLLLGAGAASAQSGGVCQLVGTAILQNGVVDEDAAPEGGKFGFTGVLSGPAGECAGLKVCSVGTLANATCLENQHSGVGKICTACSLTCDNPATPTVEACDGGTIGNGFAAIQCTGEQASVNFQGLCVGSNCSGGAASIPGMAYSLFFDVPTIQNALAVCDAPPAGDGDSITSASFTGVLAWGGP